ncbi:hypothetical protein BCV59_25675 [Escherichia coli]|nr:hypothetical protein BCV59_25675 [Escherichia coli]AOM58311.1 hypothetical protein CFSAN004177_00850 [Escherichia coli]
MRNTLIPILVAICLFITGVAILNIQLWYSAKAEYLAGATISIIYLKKRHRRLKQRLTLPGRNATSRSNISLALKQL